MAKDSTKTKLTGQGRQPHKQIDQRLEHQRNQVHVIRVLSKSRTSRRISEELKFNQNQREEKP